MKAPSLMRKLHFEEPLDWERKLFSIVVSECFTGVCTWWPRRMLIMCFLHECVWQSDFCLCCWVQVAWAQFQNMSQMCWPTDMFNSTKLTKKTGKERVPCSPTHCQNNLVRLLLFWICVPWDSLQDPSCYSNECQEMLWLWIKALVAWWTNRVF